MNQDSPSNQPFGAQINNFGFSERWLIVVLILVAFAALFFSVLSLHEASEAAALRESVATMRETVRTNNAKIEILQYDHNALKAQLVAKGLYQGTEH